MIDARNVTFLECNDLCKAFQLSFRSEYVRWTVNFCGKFNSFESLASGGKAGGGGICGGDEWLRDDRESRRGEMRCGGSS